MSIQEIIDKCECGVYLCVNQHRDSYENVEQYLDYCMDEQDAEQLKEMIKTNTIYHLQFYPDTPIGSYSVYGASLDYVVKVALDILRNL